MFGHAAETFVLSRLMKVLKISYYPPLNFIAYLLKFRLVSPYYFGEISPKPNETRAWEKEMKKLYFGETLAVCGYGWIECSQCLF